MSNRKEDPLWNEVCIIIDRRDAGDQLQRIMTFNELKIAKGLVGRADRCHILARSIYPNEIYNPKNIIKVNHVSHLRLDNCQCPLTGESISRNKRDWWWWRLIYKTTEHYDSDTDYMQLLKEYIITPQ